MSQLVLVYGLSGSGKSSAARILEDAGFRVLRNLPPFLIKESLEDGNVRDGDQSKIAVFPEINNDEDVKTTVGALTDLVHRGLKIAEIFLEASDETLLKRYKESRRPHPAKQGVGVLDSIHLERALLAPLHVRAQTVIATDELRISQLGDSLFDSLGSMSQRKMVVTFTSFGFKHGVPPEVDLCFDVRFLTNPYFVDDLRDKNGTDPEVSRYVLEKEEAKAFVQKFIEFFEFLLPLYEREGKNYLTVGIGCTGGQHRSVAIVDELARHFRNEDLNVVCMHRDVKKSG
jgi:UPF0042 nucleotide-binding protein